MDIALSDGAIVLSGILSGSKSYGAETMSVVRRSDSDQGDPAETVKHYDEDPSWRDEISEFADAVLENKPIRYGTSDDALKTMRLVYQIYCADIDWKTQWDLDDQVPDIPFPPLSRA